MSANSTFIYTGPWVNWSHGLVLGSTITLSARNGAILTSFIATFVTMVGAQLWKMLCFLIHQTRVTQEPRDGLYHQHQNVFRNSSTPGGAAWYFMLQSWHWRGRARQSLLRSIPWILFSVAYIAVFAVLSIFGSSQIAKAAGQDRLLRGRQCGYWHMDGSETGQTSFEAKVLVDSQSAATYARECYGGSVDALKCNTYATPYISWEGKKAECAFKDGICYGNNTFQMDTGFVDSHHDLGVNTPWRDRLKYRKVTTCSVLREKEYISQSNGTMLVTWNYGPAVGENYTVSYSKYSVHANIGYTAGTLYSNAGESSAWEPAAPLNRTDADVHLIWIAANSIIFDTTNDDPVFSAHLVSNVSIPDMHGRKRKYYEADYYLGVIACAEQHQMCDGDTCTQLSGSRQLFSNPRGQNMVQQGIFQRLRFANVFAGIAQVINGRSGTALRASESVTGINQASLPSNQWEIEVSSWFSTGLVMLQKNLREYASPADLLPGTDLLKPQTPVDQAMCYSQKTKVTNGTISFSVLGLAITLVVGTLIILTSCALDTVVGWIGLQSHRSWVLDEKLQLQRMVFEGRGVSWTNTEGPGIPVTEAGERFPSVGTSPESQALMAQDAKTATTSVSEFSRGDV